MRRGKGFPGRVAVSLLLALAVLLSVVPAAAAQERDRGHARKGFERGEDFEDMAEAQWAARYVVSAQMMGLIRGYAEGGHLRFKPNQPLKRQEAVALVVRAMGLQTEAEAAGTVSGSVYQLPFRDADQIQPWARGYVAVAVQRGLLDTSDPMFQPMKAASRLWTVELMVRALGLQQQAEQRKGEALSFRDAAAIPADAVGYVAVAVDVGLVAGFEDGTFRPNRPVTRAEMAKLLEKLSNEVQQEQPQAQPQGVLRGVVVAAATDSLTIRAPSGQEQTVPVAANAYVFVDDRQAALGDVKPGYEVKVFVGTDGRAVLVDARSFAAQPAPRPERHPLKRKVIAFVVSVTPQVTCVRAPCEGGSITVEDPAGRRQTFPVAAWAEVTIEGYGFATLGDLRAGDRVKLTLRGDVVVEVEVKNEGGAEEGLPPAPGAGQQPGAQTPVVSVGLVRGLVASVGADALDIAQDTGQTVTVKVDASTMIWIGSRFGTLGDLRVGDRVTVQVVNGVAVRIKAEGGREHGRGRGRGED